MSAPSISAIPEAICVSAVFAGKIAERAERCAIVFRKALEQRSAKSSLPRLRNK
jgi:hypothetical protein